MKSFTVGGFTTDAREIMQYMCIYWCQSRWKGVGFAAARPSIIRKESGGALAWNQGHLPLTFMLWQCLSKHCFFCWKHLAIWSSATGRKYNYHRKHNISKTHWDHLTFKHLPPGSDCITGHFLNRHVRIYQDAHLHLILKASHINVLLTFLNV